MLVDWLIDVHRLFKMAPDTLFLAIYIFDKYLETNKIAKNDL